MFESDRSKGIWMGVGITIGAEIVLVVILIVAALAFFSTGKIRTEAASMRTLPVSRDEVLALYGDKSTIPLDSLQRFMLEKLVERRHALHERAGPGLQTTPRSPEPKS